MISNEVTIPDYKRNEERYIAFFGDIHGGCKNCSKSGLRKTVKWIEEHKAYWIGMGDSFECILPSDVRFDPQSLADEFPASRLGSLVQSQIDEIATILAPIAKRCLGIHGGNHEDKLFQKILGTFDPVDYFISRLELKASLQAGTIKNLGYGIAWNRITFVDKSDKVSKDVVNVVTAHGHQSSIYEGATVNAMKRAFGYYDNVDVLAQGHSHVLVAVPFVAVGANNKGKLRLGDLNKVALSTGSYLKTFEEGAANYAEKKGLAPRAIGFAYVTMKFNPKHISGYVEVFSQGILKGE